MKRESSPTPNAANKRHEADSDESIQAVLQIVHDNHRADSEESTEPRRSTRSSSQKLPAVTSNTAQGSSYSVTGNALAGGSSKQMSDNSTAPLPLAQSTNMLLYTPNNTNTRPVLPMTSATSMANPAYLLVNTPSGIDLKHLDANSAQYMAPVTTTDPLGSIFPSVTPDTPSPPIHHIVGLPLNTASLSYPSVTNPLMLRGVPGGRSLADESSSSSSSSTDGHHHHGSGGSSRSSRSGVGSNGSTGIGRVVNNRCASNNPNTTKVTLEKMTQGSRKSTYSHPDEETVRTGLEILRNDQELPLDGSHFQVPNSNITLQCVDYEAYYDKTKYPKTRLGSAKYVKSCQVTAICATDSTFQPVIRCGDVSGNCIGVPITGGKGKQFVRGIQLSEWPKGYLFYLEFKFQCEDGELVTFNGPKFKVFSKPRRDDPRHRKSAPLTLVYEFWQTETVTTGTGPWEISSLIHLRINESRSGDLGHVNPSRTSVSAYHHSSSTETTMNNLPTTPQLSIPLISSSSQQVATPTLPLRNTNQTIMDFVQSSEAHDAAAQALVSLKGSSSSLPPVVQDELDK